MNTTTTHKKMSQTDKPIMTDWSQDRSVDEIKLKILNESRFIDIKPYSHNIVGLELNMLAQKTSNDYVNNYIYELNLHKLGWHLPEQFYKDKGIEEPTEGEKRHYKRLHRRQGAGYMMESSSEEESSEEESSSEESSSEEEAEEEFECRRCEDSGWIPEGGELILCEDCSK
jgi:nitric oxide reductase activation protein